MKRITYLETSRVAAWSAETRARLALRGFVELDADQRLERTRLRAAGRPDTLHGRLSDVPGYRQAALTRSLTGRG